MAALKRHRKVQNAEWLRAGGKWEDNDPVFCTQIGRSLMRRNVPRDFRKVAEAAEISDWKNVKPYDMQHTYGTLVNQLGGLSPEEVAQLLGQSRTSTFETGYRHNIKPRRRGGQQAMYALISDAARMRR